MPVPSRRASQVEATRDAILAAAERLFADRGVHAVSNRQISQAAGQGNNAAVSYHFGTKADLVRAIVDRHSSALESIRARRIAEIDDPTDLREWVGCAVRSVAEYIDSLGRPSWYGQFVAQIGVDPAYRSIELPESSSQLASLRALRDGLRSCLPDLPESVSDQRSAMTRHLIAQMSQERGSATRGADAVEIDPDSLVDVIVALWGAPVYAAAGSRHADRPETVTSAPSSASLST